MRTYRDTTTKGPTQRQLKVGEQIRHILSEVLHRNDFHDEVLSRTVVNVCEVRVTPDLRHAKVFVLPLEGAEVKEVVDVLNALAPKLRHRLASQMTTKFLPKLYFVADQSYYEADKIEALFRQDKVKQDLVSDE